ncbi:1-deoxy-D-xylulose-5-phosphate reductoisomerase [Candidatus Fermentibacteria bacterium]|nr:1-deoxy-D-xylulose-5-phosphate reductoisomerase [Candidatus Fermentibacteria bacterium]
MRPEARRRGKGQWKALAGARRRAGPFRQRGRGGPPDLGLAGRRRSSRGWCGLRKIAVLGSTGSIGKQALEVIERSPGLEVWSLLCGRNAELVLRQARKLSPKVVAVADPRFAPSDVLSGPDSMRACIEGADMVLNAIVGFAGIRASILCSKLDVPLALANKESLVTGGPLLGDFVRRGMIVPVDSEHSTIFRCLAGETKRPLGLLLTASGGAMRDTPLDELRLADAAQVLDHPTWSMGARITVDSASMVNKAFEVVEAGWLFGADLEIDVAIHRQSIVHSLVRLADGSWKALLGAPDMRVPIQYALQWPEGELYPVLEGDRPTGWEELTFERVDNHRYPAFETIVSAVVDDHSYAVAANAADEVAVEAFLQGRLRFGGVVRVIEETLRRHDPTGLVDLETIESIDSDSRAVAEEVVRVLCL